ncbi:phosphoribosylformylglycinamidine cyclo-ligase [Clostridia bacterium]|nr:phosphoribosylformylglycinamidine cyclo-ligase [Clostridia bacterium]
MSDKKTGAYASRGVSATKDEVHGAVKDTDKGIFPGAFTRISPDIAGDSDYCSIMHADGAGTKSVAAYILYKEINDARAFRGIAVDSVVMNLDDMVCAGAAERFIFSNAINRNAHRVGGDAIKEIVGGYVSFAERMKKYGIEITMCGGETADTGDIVQTVLVDSTFFARLRRDRVVNCSNIRPGNVIVGFASFGKCEWEDAYNSGIGSNGLTAARHLLLHKSYRTKYPETYSQTIVPDDVYVGKYRVTDPLPGAALSVGEAILSPTRTFAPVIKDVLTAHFDKISGIIHNTGGGLTKCKGFGSGVHYIKDNLFEPPAIFKAIADSGAISTHEIHQVFNMGQRMEIYTDSDTAQAVIAAANKYGVEAQVIGRVEASANDANHVTIITGGGETLKY